MREIRSPLLRYGLSLGSFVVIVLLAFGIERISPFNVDLTSMIIIAMIARPVTKRTLRNRSIRSNLRMQSRA